MGSEVSSFFGTVKSTASGIASGAKAVASGVSSGLSKASNFVQRNRTRSRISGSSLFFRRKPSALGPKSLSGSYTSKSLFSPSQTSSSFSSTNPLQSIATGIGVGLAKNTINHAVYSRPISKSLSSINKINKPVQKQNTAPQQNTQNPATQQITQNSATRQITQNSATLQNRPQNPAPRQNRPQNPATQQNRPQNPATQQNRPQNPAPRQNTQNPATQQNRPQNPATQQITQNSATQQNIPENPATQQITQKTGGSRKKKSSKK